MGSRYKRQIRTNSAGDVIEMVPAASGTERKFVANLLETGEVKKSAEMAGVSEQTGWAMMKRPSVVAHFERALTRAGIDDAALAQRLLEALSATRAIPIPDGKGGILEIKEVPDHYVRLRAVKLIVDSIVKLRTLGMAEETHDERPRLPENIDEMGTVEIMKLIVKRTRG